MPTLISPRSHICLQKFSGFFLATQTLLIRDMKNDILFMLVNILHEIKIKTTKVMALKACEGNLSELMARFGNLLRYMGKQQCFFVTESRLVSPIGTVTSIPDDNQTTSKHESIKKTPKPLWYYSNKGIRKRKIDQLMRNSLDENKEMDGNETPSKDLLHIKQLIPVLESWEFSRKEISDLLFTKPRIFELNKHKVYSRLMEVENYGYSKDVVKKMVLKYPAILLINDKEISFQRRFLNLQELPLIPALDPQRCIYLIQKCPSILSIAEKSSLVSKLKNLDELGFNQQLKFTLVMKYPHILTYSEEAVKEKVEYINNEMGGRVGLFVKFPRVFSASMQRIKDRHLFLVKEAYLSTDSKLSEKKLRAIILTTDKDFVYRVTRTSLKDFRNFQQRLRAEESAESGGSEMTDKNTLSRDSDRYSEEEESGEDIIDDAGDDSKQEQRYFNAFQRDEEEDDFYNVPFPPIQQQPLGLKKKSRTSGYRPLKKNQASKFS